MGQLASVMRTAFAAGLVCLAASLPAAAQMKSAVTAAEIERILMDAGLSPTMTEDAATRAPVASGQLG